MKKKDNVIKYALWFLAGIVFTVIVLLLANAVYATAPPCPIGLIIKAVPDSAAIGLHIVLKNSIGSVIAQSVTNEYGEVLFELGGIADCVSYTAVVIECESNPICTKIVAFNPEGYTVWDIAYAPPTTTTTTTLPPATTTTTPPTTTTLPCDCASCCPECPICPVQDIVGMLIALVFGAGAGYGIKVYMSRTGEAKLLHKHVGIVSYHDPNTIHTNLLYRHKKGELAPKLPNKL